MAILLEVGKPLPKHPTYSDDATARAFWRLTFETGRKYIYGLDAMGNAILIPHEREKEGYKRRQRITKPRNHSGPIIRRYNNHVFRIEPARPEGQAESDLYQLMLTDADGEGTNLPAFMAKALHAAQIERESYILLDSTKDYDGELSQAQADEMGSRSIFRLIGADAVLNWTEYNGCLTSALVLMSREDGTEFAMLYDKETATQVEVESKDGSTRITSIGAAEDHAYDGMPLVRLRPFDGESQISPLAESQMLITNMMSLLLEENYNATFSQSVASGVASTEVGEAMVGNNRLICLPNPAASWNVIGADPAQADSIRKTIEDEQRELYRIAGISSDDPTKSGSPESGIAKAFKHNDLSANLAALAGAVEDAENRAMALMFGALGEKYPGDVKYPDEFDIPSIADDLTELIQAVTVQSLPNTIKKKMAERFQQRHIALTDEEKTSFKTELDQISNDPLTNQPSGMQGT